jgi:hypothetical protein
MSRLRRLVVSDHGFFITYRWLPRPRMFSLAIPTGWAVDGVLLPTDPRTRLQGWSEENNLAATRWRGSTAPNRFLSINRRKARVFRLGSL